MYGWGVPRNVLHFFNAYQDPHPQDPLEHADPKTARGSLYVEGIGVRAHTPLGDVFAKAFGLAGHARLKEARERLDRNLAVGDTGVDIIGFSRGAALAVDFANQVCKKVPNANVRFVGLWDIVAHTPSASCAKSGSAACIRTSAAATATSG
ncbi:MAG: hypothetical protein ABIT71_21175 [Vicinamibacteraceae bacterium]